MICLLGWGLVYGVLWWFIGTNTLFNVLLRIPVGWSLGALVSRYPALLGHLIFGAGLGLFYEVLIRRFEGRMDPRIIPQSDLGRFSPLLRSPAPALWFIVVLIGLLLPILLGGGPAGPGY